MKLLLIWIILFLPDFYALCQTFEYELKSPRIYANDDETSLPVISADRENDFITIEFDIKTSFQPSLNIIFKFCDKNWSPYENLLLENMGNNTSYSLWYESLPASIEGADYHYEDNFPNDQVTFPFPGKWKFYVTDSQNPSDVLYEGKFFVVSETLNLRSNLKKIRKSGSISSPNVLDKIFELTVNFDLPTEMFPGRVVGLEIIENQKIGFPILVNRENKSDFRFFEWNGANSFTFTIRDIQPGNEYRETDTRDQNIYFKPVVKSQLDGVETSRFYSRGSQDLNGGAILKSFIDPYSDYLTTEFSIRPPDDFDVDIYLVGAFTNWEILPENQLIESSGIFKTVKDLKRGIYDYQYVTVDRGDHNVLDADWFALEGNFWETENDYHIFLYYDEPDKGDFDKIIAYTKINSKGN